MGLSVLLPVAAGAILLALTYRHPQARARLRRRPAGDLLLDGSGLLVQGILVPILAASVLGAALGHLLPGWRGRLALPGGLAFLVSFVAVDYAYYWNHRLLHEARLFRWHAVHHTAEALDVLPTSRNALLAHGLVLYVWVQALGIYLLAEPAGFLLGAAATAALDLWRHSGLRPGGWAGRLLAAVLITPVDHAWHHSRGRPDVNFGANLALWDRLHGTYHRAEAPPAELGLAMPPGLLRRLLLPPRPVPA